MPTEQAATRPQGMGVRHEAAAPSQWMSDREVISLFVMGRRPSRVRIALRALRAGIMER